MKSIYLRNLFITLLQKKKPILLSVLLFTLLMGLIGVRTYRNTPSGDSEEIKKELEEYEEILQGYDDAIADLQQDIVIAQDQLEVIENYCKNSIYMKLDAQKIYVSTAQFGIQTTAPVANILSAWAAYINDGSLRTEISQELVDVPEEYLKELITCSTSGNVLIVSVMHYEEPSAKLILDAIKKQLPLHADQIAAVQGEFTLLELDTSNTVKADTAVMNAQNTHLNNYKTNQSSLSGLKRSLADQKNARKVYVENNKPETPEEHKSVTVILKYLLFGIILGFGVPGSVFGLRYIMEDRVRCAKSLQSFGLPVLGLYKRNVQTDAVMERDAMELKLLADQKKTESIYLDLITDDPDLMQMSSTFTSQLERQKLTSYQGTNVRNRVEELKKLLQIGHCVLVLKAGDTTFTRLEKELQMCQKFKIDVWGCMIIE